MLDAMLRKQDAVTSLKQSLEVIIFYTINEDLLTFSFKMFTVLIIIMVF